MSPVGDYYAGGVGKGVDALVIDEYDRAAPKGTGNVKVGGNYAADLVPATLAKESGFPIALYLDAKTNSFVEEFSTSNFVAIAADGAFVTPESPAILNSVTRRVLMQLAEDAGLTVEQRQIPYGEVASMREVGACGTAVVLTPIASVTRDGHRAEFGELELLRQLREACVDIQYGDAEDVHGWCVPVV